MVHPVEARRAARAEIQAVTTRLVAEFAVLPAGAVIGCVARTREELLRAGVRHGLAHAVEAAARQRLGAILPARA